MTDSNVREPINLSDTTLEVITNMGERNPGALNVLVQLIKRVHDPAALMTILSLDDMNIRGSQIWVGYKDHCKQDLEVFAQAIKNRDQSMVDTINSECYHPNDPTLDGYTEKAVTSGASFNHMADQHPDIRGMGL